MIAVTTQSTYMDFLYKWCEYINIDIEIEVNNVRSRHIEILNILLKNKEVSKQKLKELYSISTRSLYYDLETINYNIKRFGIATTESNIVKLELFNSQLEEELNRQVFIPYLESKERQNYILFSILNDEGKRLKDYSNQLQVSQTTIFSDIQMLKSDLISLDIDLHYHDNQYIVEGSEKKIRDKYLELLFLQPFDYLSINPKIVNLNLEKKLNLSDYSMFYFSEFLQFISVRNKKGYFIEDKYSYIEKMDNYLSFNLERYIDITSKNEQNYLKTFILSIANIIHPSINNYVDKYVRKLLNEVKKILALDVIWTEKFILNLKNHLLSSYFRIKFDFPALNHQLLDIKVKYFYLFSNIKNIISSIEIEPFDGMRDEEIGFVTAYIGGQLNKNKFMSEEKNIIIVCPQGRAVSNHLLLQIQKEFPDINVVGTYSIDQLGSIVTDYDYIITTVELKDLENVLKVNPIMSKLDISKLEKYFGDSKYNESLVDQILKIVQKYSTIHSQEKLKEAIQEKIDKQVIAKGYEPMIHELITKEKIQIKKSVNNWEEAIEIAAQPLLDDESINKEYIKKMIESVYEYGPYIVLKEGFALPHASSNSGVNKLSMSMLSLEEPIDVLGKEADIFIVLATVDNNSHLKALASLTKIISDDEAFDSLRKATTVDELYKIIKNER